MSIVAENAVAFDRSIVPDNSGTLAEYPKRDLQLARAATLSVFFACGLAVSPSARTEWCLEIIFGSLAAMSVFFVRDAHQSRILRHMLSEGMAAFGLARRLQDPKFANTRDIAVCVRENCRSAQEH
jgi:hypothetical protein